MPRTNVNRMARELEVQVARAVPNVSVSVDESDLHPARGYWTHKHQDVMAWQGYVLVDGRRYSVGSWSSITECLRKRFTVVDQRGQERIETDFEVHVL